MFGWRRDRWIVNLTIAGLAVAGASAIAVAAAAQTHAPTPPTSAAGTVDGPTGGSPTGSPTAAGSSAAPTPTPSAGQPTAPSIIPASTPTAIDIPAIGVHSTLIQLGQARDGSLEVPRSYQQAGWYDGSVTPGQGGPAIILGHVDSHNGPGVFFKLGALRPGDQVRVARADGRTVVFTITGVRKYAKDAFPTAEVYGGTGKSTIRLITCGGEFDSATGHYLSNIIAFGQLIG
ncbi:MAG TPA: class F sortase [Mycobacteriales bacterium]|jgi:sortase (surface protein transpeptidase)|nr:class F sortase [Mycobacteriales bacterium]